MSTPAQTRRSLDTPNLAENRGTPLSPSLRGELEALEAEVEKVKTAKEKDEVLVSSLENFLSPEEQKLLETLEKGELPTETIKDYLKTAASILGAIFERNTGKTPASLQEIVDHFSGKNSASVEVSKKALVYIINHSEAPVSMWFLGSAWNETLTDAHEFFKASQSIEATIKPEKEAGLMDKMSEFAKNHKDELKMTALAGGLGVGIFALSRFFKGQTADASAPSPTSPKAVSSALKYGTYAAGGAFVLGRALGSDWVQDTFATDNDSFLNSRWIKALIAFAYGEFGNASRFLFEGAPSQEAQKRFQDLAGLFGVEASGLYPISKMKAKDYLDGKPSTLLNLDSQKKTDDQVRERIKDNYLTDLQAISGYENMTMEVLFLEGLKRGIFTNRDVSKLPEGDRLAVLAQKKDATVRRETMKVHFDNPKENVSALRADAAELLTDVQEVHDFAPSWWGDTGQYLEAALGLQLFTDADDEHEYGDIKGMREQIMAITDDGVKKDQQVFIDMAKEVQGFQDFLTAHPDSDQWTADELTQFTAYKDRILTIRTQLDSARQTANERNVEHILEDQKEITMEDLKEGVQFTVSGLGAGVYNTVRFEAQEVYDGSYAAYALVVTQVAGASYAVLQSGKWGILRTPLTALTGTVTGPLKTFAMGRDFFRARTAYGLTSSELLAKYLKGDLTKVDLEERLAWAKRYTYMVEKGPMGAARAMPGPGRTLNARWTEKLRDLSRLEHDLAHLRAWEDHFNAGAPLAPGDQAMDALKTHLTDAQILEIEQLSASGATPAARRAAQAASRITTEVLADGRSVIRVDGNIVNVAKTPEAAAEIERALIAAAEKQGKHLDFIKLRNVLKFAEPLMQIAGVGFTVNLFYRIQNAEGPEALEKIVAEETANLLTFFAGAKLTMEVLLKLRKPGSPSSATAYAVISLMGGFAASMGLNTPINHMIEKFLDSFPNGYAITESAADVLEMGSALTTVKMLRPVVQSLEKTAIMRGITEVAGERLAALAEKDFVKKLATVCGWDAIKMLLQKSGWKGAVAGLFAGVDGPAPIGDALGALFLTWTAKDVYDLSILVWEGYNLNTELNRRLPMKVAKFDLKEPETLKAQYEQLAATDPEAAFDAILKEPNATVRIQREGDAGYEIWSTQNGEISSLALYDMKGGRIAGLNDEDLQRIVKAQEEVAAA